MPVSVTQDGHQLAASARGDRSVNAVETRGGFVHRGVLHRSDRHLLAETVPVLARAAAEGHRVVVVGGCAPRHLMHDALGDARWASVSYLAPGDVPQHDADDFLDWLRTSLPATGRLVVLHRYRAARRLLPESALTDVLGALPVTLLCACAHDAGAHELEAFRRAHGLVPRRAPRQAEHSGGLEGARSAPVLQACFSELAHLHVLRDRVATAAAAAGFDRCEQERAVLAVHEASVVACRLVEGVRVDTADAGVCELVASTTRSTMVVEIHLPRRVRLPPVTTDDDPLRWVRTFTDETSWSGGGEARRLRLVLHASSGARA